MVGLPFNRTTILPMELSETTCYKIESDRFVAEIIPVAETGEMIVMMKMKEVYQASLCFHQDRLDECISVLQRVKELIEKTL